MHMERKHTLIDNAAEKRYELDLGDGMASTNTFCNTDLSY